MKLIVKKCLSILFVSALLLLVIFPAPLISEQQSHLNSIEDDFQDLQKNLPSLKNLLFLDPAPNSHYDDRGDKKVLMVVVHHTESPTLKSTKCALNSSGISVQLIVDRDGSVTLMVPLEKRAWHAGISYAKVQIDDMVKELQKLNDYSIGIEIVNTGLEPFSEEQMRSVKDLILYLMERFKIRKDMIFGHAEIGTIVYNPAIVGYVMRKPDPHKLFDWELLEKNGIGLHIGDRINSQDAEQKVNEILYKMGDKGEDILKLKKRLNNFLYKIEPGINKEGSIIFPENGVDYSDEFDESFAWVISQFSMRHLPKEIRKELLLKLEWEDILPELLSEYGKCIFKRFKFLSDKIESSLQPPFLNEADYKCLLSFLAQYENNVSSNAFAMLMYKIKLYYDSYLRYNIRSSLYMPFKLNVFVKLDTLKNEISFLKSLSPEKAIEVSSLIDEFRSEVLSDFQDFEKQWFQEFKDTWKQEFIPNMEKQMYWTALHETILEYLEKAKEEVLKTNLAT
ncbi:N-acetylmuramoyl-L-alanine amidase [Wolbachia endosymbiont of Ctenocephalides felis wCfeJ]|uniref:N-acetylmuramoyl-L-alanine amidase n=1 Tax=Wolbachia endosymbiont of Ctenocephalides felis wCfeJ TaxID=2732594 RepID=UPI00144689E0|nr:N-acetylmuramoyl-L-alanine amidase [Wolbachia endosymbiont of Ctenocephalides felis wCfeJ]WCR57565.1 MAG: 1,6-anhydro-N-acetylmuramyl-L-alanine amidase AmpD [Wolbachia endosymbiont of Ctenocephalides felis wCfeJ]